MKTAKKTALWVGLVVALGAAGFLTWDIATLPSDSYNYGYARAFTDADMVWTVYLPPPSTCEELGTEGTRYDHALNFDEIVAGCHSGYWDAVQETRGRLGWPQLIHGQQ